MRNIDTLLYTLQLQWLSCWQRQSLWWRCGASASAVLCWRRTGWAKRSRLLPVRWIPWSKGRMGCWPHLGPSLHSLRQRRQQCGLPPRCQAPSRPICRPRFLAPTMLAAPLDRWERRPVPLPARPGGRTRQTWWGWTFLRGSVSSVVLRPWAPSLFAPPCFPAPWCQSAGRRCCGRSKSSVKSCTPAPSRTLPVHPYHLGCPLMQSTSPTSHSSGRWARAALGASTWPGTTTPWLLPRSASPVASTSRRSRLQPRC